MEKKKIGVFVFVLLLLGGLIVFYFFKLNQKPKTLEVLFISNYPIGEKDENYPKKVAQFFHVFENDGGHYYPQFQMKRIDTLNTVETLYKLSSDDMDSKENEMDEKYATLKNKEATLEMYCKMGVGGENIKRDTTDVRTFILDESGGAKVDNIRVFNDLDDLHKKMSELSESGNLIGKGQKPDAVVILFLSGNKSIISNDLDGDGFDSKDDCDDNDDKVYPGAACDDKDRNTENDLYDDNCDCKGAKIDGPKIEEPEKEDFPKRPENININWSIDRKTRITTVSWNSVEGAYKYRLKIYSQDGCSFEVNETLSRNSYDIEGFRHKEEAEDCQFEAKIEALDQFENIISSASKSKNKIWCR